MSSDESETGPDDPLTRYVMPNATETNTDEKINEATIAETIKIDLNMIENLLSRFSLNFQIITLRACFRKFLT